MNADIVKQTSELLVKLESSGYIDLKAAFVTKDCCGEMGIIDYSCFENTIDGISQEQNFRIQVKPEHIEIAKLEFKHSLLTHAKFKTADNVIETLNHFEKIDADFHI